MPKLLVAAEVSRSLLEFLSVDDRFDVNYRPCRDEEELVSAAADAEIIVTRHYNRVTRRVIEAAPRLRLIAQGTSGTDNIDMAAAAVRQVAIINTPGSNANAVAELVIANMIALTRTIPQYQRMITEGRWDRRDCDTRHELRYFPLGIVGLGRVGSRVARAASLFGMRVAGYDPYLSDHEFQQRGADRAASLHDLLRRSRILSLHVPLTDETRRMIGEAELALLPTESYVINASRGEVLDFAALRAAMASGHIAGAALDVFDPEPPDNVRGVDDPRLILTPHIAGCSAESKESIGRELYREICRFAGFDPVAS